MKTLGGVVVGLVEAAARWGQVEVLSDMQSGRVDIAAAEASDARVNAIGGLSSLAMLASAIGLAIAVVRQITADQVRAGVG